jgi:hypothetical protein
VRLRVLATAAAVALGGLGGWLALRDPAPAAPSASAPLPATVAVLTPADLPGFTAVPSSGRADDGTDPRPCGRGAGLTALGPQDARHRSVLARAQPDLFVTSTVASSSTLEPLRAMFAGCTAWTINGYRYTVSPLGLDPDPNRYADETFAVTLSVDTGSATVRVAFAALRRGPHVASVSVVSTSPLAPGDVSPVLAAAAGTLR